MRREPFVLKYGKFAGKSIEWLMFQPKGYLFLRGVLKKGKKSPFTDRVRRLVEKGESSSILENCPLCQQAKVSVVLFRADSSGICFFGRVCRQCADKKAGNQFQMMELKFSGIAVLRGSLVDQELFIRELKKAFGLSSPLTAEKAHDFFYPEPQVPAKKIVQRNLL